MISEAALAFIASSLASANINYEFGVWKSDLVYPYFVGSYTETESMNEDGLQESTFILDGFTRGTWLDLENAKKNIEILFPSIGGKHTIVQDGSAVAVFYGNSMNVPTGVAELKRIQINIRILEWKV